MFIPLIFSTSGGMGKDSSVFYKRLAHSLSMKTQWLRCRLNFALLRSAILCIRGSRSTTLLETDSNLASAESRLSPDPRGHHELIVTVNGQEVAGSPFPVFVSIHPSKLGKPVKIIPGLNLPSGIAFDSKGEMIVAELLGDVVVLDRNGKKLRSIKRSDHKFKDLSSVAVDNEDNIYFDEWNGKNAYRFDKNMKKVMQKQIGHGSCNGVAVVGDEVMVSGVQYHPVIEVYDTELNFVRKIRGDKGYFNHISSDGHGKLYVGATSHSRIQVLSKGGEFLHSFGSDENGVNKLSNPRGVCVAGQYVYATDYSNNNISIFTTEGEYEIQYSLPSLLTRHLMIVPFTNDFKWQSTAHSRLACFPLVSLGIRESTLFADFSTFHSFTTYSTFCRINNFYYLSIGLQQLFHVLGTAHLHPYAHFLKIFHFFAVFFDLFLYATLDLSMHAHNLRMFDKLFSIFDHTLDNCTKSRHSLFLARWMDFQL